MYTADVSGVCSALYELGGMTVMHDPSGCNSTYNTHDETRWYEKDSLIFISGLTQMDAVMGNDSRFVDDVADAAFRLKPRFIAICGSPVPFLNGTDFTALAKLIGQKTGIPCFAVETNGMHDYVQGAGKALEKIAQRFVKEPGKKNVHSVNILGMTPLDFAAKGSAASMREILESAGLRVQSVWAMESGGFPAVKSPRAPEQDGTGKGDLLDTLAASGEAAVNLVVSQTGLLAAKVMEERFHIPYVAGVPLAPIREDVVTALLEAEKDGENRLICKRAYASEGGRFTVQAVLIGEPVTMGSLAAAIQKKHGCAVRIWTPMERSQELLAKEDGMFRAEEVLERELGRLVELKQEIHVVADPLYRPIIPKGIAFHPLPHAAFSGRCCLREMPDFLSLLRD